MLIRQRHFRETGFTVGVIPLGTLSTWFSGMVGDDMCHISATSADHPVELSLHLQD